MTVVRKEPCPVCTANGGDTSGDNLAVYADGGSYCFACGYSTRSEGEEYMKKTMKEALINSQPRALAKRGVSKEVCEFFGYGLGLYTGNLDGESVSDEPVHVANYYNNLGEPIAQKLRGSGKRMKTVGDFSSTPLFGANKYRPNPDTFITVVEGEIDALSVAEAQGTRFPVVSVPSGAQGAVKAIKANYEYLNGFKHVVLGFDNDEAGRKAADDCSKLFDHGKVRIATWDMKDANELLVAGRSQDIKRSLFEAQEIRPDSLLWVDDLRGTLEQPKEGLSWPWGIMTGLTYGIRPGELYTLGAGCVDQDTEYLTEEGWAPIGDYSGGKVAQIHDDGSMSFVTPSKYHKYPSDGFNHFKTKYGLDMMLCDNHNVVYTYDGYPEYKVMACHEVIRRHKASNTKGWTGKIPTTFTYDGPGLGLSEHELRLQIAVNADGRQVNGGKDRYTQMRFIKKRKYERLLAICMSGGLRYDDRGINSQGQYEVIVWPALDKGFTKGYFKMSSEDAKIIADECLFWDGNQKSAFFSANRLDCDVVQYANILAGYRSRVLPGNKGTYETHRNSRTSVGFTNRHGKNSIPRVQNGEFKYCFTVPTGRLVLRRNGCVFVTGNSGVGKTEWLKDLLLHLTKTHGERVGTFFLEQKPSATLLRIIGGMCGKRLHLPGVEWDQDEIDGHLDELGNTVSFYNGPHLIDDVYDRILYLHKAEGVNYFIIDHLTALSANMGSKVEEIDQAMSKLGLLIQKYPISLFVVSHLAAPPTGETTYEEGRKVTARAFRGSQSIQYWSSFMIGLERDKTNEDEERRTITTVRILKDRFSGESDGCTFFLKYNRNSGRLEELGTGAI